MMKYYKFCQEDLYEGLDITQMEYAMQYSLDKYDLQYKDYKIQLGCSRRLTVTACCREHARDMYPDVVSVSYLE